MSDLTPEQHAAIAHWAEFGRSGAADPERWVPGVRELRQLHMFSRPRSASMDDVLDAGQTDVLMRGVGWRQMEDKWVVWSGDPDGERRSHVHFHRSWTGFEIVRVGLQLAWDGSSHLFQITWETNPKRISGADEASARSTFVEVCRWVLGMRPVPDPPADQAASGTP